MHNFGTFFLWALAACLLCHGSLAKDLRSNHIFLPQDLVTHIDNTAVAQDQGKPRDADNDRKELKIGEIQAIQDEQLQEVEAKLVDHLRGVEAKLEGQLQGVEAKLEEQRAVLTKVESKLGESLLAMQTRLDNQHQALLEKIENLLQAVSNKTDVAKVPSGFEQIGTRYFRIVDEPEDWDTARRRCCELGGYLASFRDEEEMNAVSRNLTGYMYWLGINDQETEGQFVSVASGKPAEFFNRREEKQSYFHNCVAVNPEFLKVTDCWIRVYFICQADNET